MWRYGAIADRRIRAHAWSPADMAAANALFWTPTGWDGSEEFASRSVSLAVKLPKVAHVSLLSWASAKTLIVTLQGVQAFYVIAGPLFGTLPGPSFSIDTAFIELAMLGLLRLFAALWLTDDFVYVMDDDIRIGSLTGHVSPEDHWMRDSLDLTGHLDPPTALTENRFRKTSWPSRLFRVFFITPLIAMWVTAVLWLVRGTIFTVTQFLAVVAGVAGSAVAITIYVYYAARHGLKSTVIPCIASTWYKALSGVLYFVFLVFAVISVVETRRTQCGTYTTVPIERGDPGCVQHGSTSSGF
jgi:hypothetical protein